MKAIIWDLDETLWVGTVYHGESVKLKQETKEILKQIDKLGIDQYVCSHNVKEHVFKQIDEFGLRKYFKIIKAEIGIEKDDMIQQILDETGLLPEEVVFIDDTGINRELVRLKVGCHVDFEEDLYRVMKYFDTDRLKSMNQQRTRTDFETKWTGTRKEFLKLVKNEITIKEAEESELPRITNLANRTNDLNAARSRYTMQEMRDIFESGDYVIWVAYLTDQFGDYGLIGEIIVNVSDAKHWFIKDWCVSCRTMGRGVGTELLRSVKEIANVSAVEKVTGCVIPNDDNYRMGPMYIKAGFKKGKVEDEKHYYIYEVK